MKYAEALYKLAQQAQQPQQAPAQRQGPVVPGDDLLDAIARVESNGGRNLYGDWIPGRPRDDVNNARAWGMYQQHLVNVDDANNIAGTAYTGADRLDPERSRDMVRTVMQHYGNRPGVTPSDEVFARIHNGGPNGWRNPATAGYWARVQAALAQIRAERAAQPQQAQPQQQPAPQPVPRQAPAARAQQPAPRPAPPQARPAQRPVQPAQRPVQPAQRPVQPAQRPVQPAQRPVQPVQPVQAAPAQPARRRETQAQRMERIRRALEAAPVHEGTPEMAAIIERGRAEFYAAQERRRRLQEQRRLEQQLRQMTPAQRAERRRRFFAGEDVQ